MVTCKQVISELLAERLYARTPRMIDLSGLNFIDPQGLSVLISEEMNGDYRFLLLRHPSRKLMQLLRITGRTEQKRAQVAAGAGDRRQGPVAGLC